VAILKILDFIPVASSRMDGDADSDALKGQKDPEILWLYSIRHSFGLQEAVY
jgi:hypothetical protein